MTESLLRFLAFDELRESRRLQAILACLLFYCFLVLRSWVSQPGLMANAPELMNYMPMWPLEHAPALLLPPEVHRLTLLLLAFLALASSVAVLTGRYLKQAFLFYLLLIAVEFYLYLHDLRLVANFFHVHLYLTFFFVLARQKLIFFRVALGMVYWLAALVKLTPSWLWGEYFNSVPARLPLLPSWPGLVTGASVTLLVVELLAPLLWLSPNPKLRRASAVVLLVFHLYSGVIVGHWYTTLMTPLVALALFPFEKPLFSDYRGQVRHKVMWGFVLLFLLGGAWNFLIPGDVRSTAEGRYHGLFMFDANRRVEADMVVSLEGDTHRFVVLYDWPRREVLDWSTSVSYSKNGEAFWELREPVRFEEKVLFHPDYFRRSSSRMFSDPYVFYYYGKRVLERFPQAEIQMTLTQQLDGHSYRFQVLELDREQLLSLRYSPWARNSWIRVPGPESPRSYQWW